MAEKKSPEEIFAEIQKRIGPGGFIDTARGTGDMSYIFKEIEKTGKRFTAGMNASLSIWEKAFGGSSAIESASKKGISDFKTAMMNLSAGGSVKDVGKAITAMTSQLGEVMKRSLSAGITLVGDIVGIGANIVTYANKKMSLAWQGVPGAFKAFTSTMTDGLKMMGGSFGKVGTMLDGILDNAIKAIMFQFDDALAVTRVRLRESASTGAAAGTPTVAGAETARLRPMIGRAKTEEWLTGLVDVGANMKLINSEEETLGLKGTARINKLNEINRLNRDTVRSQAEVTNSAMQVGMVLGYSAGEMMKFQGNSMALVTGTTSANDELIKSAKLLTDTFGAAQNLAKGTNVTTKMMANILQETAMNARFLNVDMKTVANTMNLLKEGEAGLKSMGMSLRADGSKIMSDWTNASAKATDALHMFFGTKGGPALGESPFKGWAASKFGSTFAGSLRETGGGGFRAEEGKSGDMYINNLKVMKDMMEKASAGTSDPFEKLMIQQRVATETFKMGDEGAKALAMQDSSKLDALIKNEAVMKGFNTEKDYLAKLQDTSVKSENIQRAMASMSMSQLQMALKSVSYLSTIALATVAAVTEKGGGKLTDKLQKATDKLATDVTTNMSTMVGDFRKVTGVIRGYLPPEVMSSLEKIMVDIERTTDILGGGVGASASEKKAAEAISAAPMDLLFRKGKAEGGPISPGAHWVGEKGPEIFTPGTSGNILSNKESMNLVSKESSPSGGKGTQIIMNFTGVLDKEKLISMITEASREALLSGGV